MVLLGEGKLEAAFIARRNLHQLPQEANSEERVKLWLWPLQSWDHRSYTQDFSKPLYITQGNTVPGSVSSEYRKQKLAENTDATSCSGRQCRVSFFM